MTVIYDYQVTDYTYKQMISIKENAEDYRRK
jgi:hypothetical protein